MMQTVMVGSLLYLVTVSAVVGWCASLERVRTAAESGVVTAQKELGLALASPPLTDSKFKEANQWLERAARAGDVEAMVGLGDLLSVPYKGGPSSWRGAVYWYKKAFDSGRTNIHARIGKAYTHLGDFGPDGERRDEGLW